MPRNPNASNPFPGPLRLSGEQSISGTCSESTSVRVVTGNLMKTLRVSSVPTLGPTLDFTLYYNSQDTVLGPVGHRWRHGYMQNLNFVGSSSTVFTNEGGRQYGFVPSGSAWVPDGESSFFNGVLTQTGTTWRITFPTGAYLTFDASGNLTSIVDRHGNTLTITWSGGVVTSVSEPTGRSISLGYTSGLLTSITDPNSNETLLTFDASSNLTGITGPEGCTLSYGYGTTPGLVLTSTDANSHQWTYTYTGNALASVTSPESATLHYAYDTVTEPAGDFGDVITLYRTKLTDARSQVWEYRFDLGYNLWRILEPLGYNRHWYWDQNQNPLYGTSPFATAGFNGYRDNPNNRFNRAAYDANSNLLEYADGTGVLSQWQYNSQNLVTMACPGRASLQVEGNWARAFGSLGYLQCAFNTGGTDRSNLPSWVAGVSNGGSAVGSTIDGRIIGPATLTTQTTWERGGGYWTNTLPSTTLTVTVTLTAAQKFNLSLYTDCVNLGGSTYSPWEYFEQEGYDQLITVTDQNGTQTFEAYNNAGGLWATFSVQGDASNPITITLTPQNNNTSFVTLSALAFDSWDNHVSTFTYNSTADILTATDPLGGLSQWTYNSDGTTATFENARSHTTQYFYEDAYKNLTRLIDASSQTWHLTYDLNSNVLSVEDPNSHTWSFEYDGKDRLVKATDPLGHSTQWVFDGAGNLIQIIDANTVSTYFYYTSTNRLARIVDAMSGQTLFNWDVAGNLLSVTDPRGHETQLSWDACERMTLLTQADLTQVTFAYDGLNQLRAFTTPNGTQPNLNAVNVTNTYNWLLNPGMELVDGNAPTTAVGWTPSGINPSGDVRDTTVSHSGLASLKLTLSNNTDYWGQTPAFLRAGEMALVRGWVETDGTYPEATTWVGLQARAASGNVTESDTTPTALPLVGAGFQQTPWALVQVPGDGQYPRFPVEALRLYAEAPVYEHVWLDDFEVRVLSRSTGYDTAGRPLLRTAPDGSQRQTTYDVYGRPHLLFDPNGNPVTLTWDGKNQLMAVTDSLGFQTQFGYDLVGNLVLVTDAAMNQTQYGYDAMDRLVSITYPDASTEGFSYDVAGNLHTYTNNRSQSRTFGYDNANRLLSMLYNTDSTQVSWTYDNVSNVLTRTERNGDVVAFSYDLLYRVTGVIRTPSGSGAASWMQTSSYDANSNRTQLDTRLLAPPEPEYGGAEYGAAVYLVPGASWTVPSGGYDAMNRLVAFQDVAGAQATLAYDVEGQRTSLAFAGGGGPLTSTYDAVNRVVGMAAPGANTTFSYATGYDLASQRTFVTVNGDHGDYQMDAKGQLVVETCNRFVETGYGAFQNGAFSAVTVDPASGNLSLVAFNDAFSGNTLNLDRWRLTMADGRYVGLAIRQEAELQFVFPFWGTNLVTSALPPVYEGVGLLSTAMYGAAEHRLALSGDFDVQVSYDHWQGLNGSQAVWAGLMVSDLPVEGTVLSPANMAFVGREHLSSGADQYIANVYVAGTLATTAPATTTDTLGRLRIKRSSSTVTLYYWNNGTSSWVLLATNTTFSMATMCVSHYFYVGPGGLATIGFTNFQVNSGNAYPSTGTYTSQVYDAGSSVAWTGLTWAASVPSGASLEFQVGVSNSPTGPFTYVGPDGTSSTYFTTSGGSFPSLTGRYASYQATFGYPGTGSSPTLSRVDLSYGGTNASTAILNQFDSVGNIIGREVDTGGNVTTETRTLNDLNQITGITVMAGGSTTAVWDLTYDLSGNLLTKTNTTTSETTTFNWDEDNRLTSVVLPGNITIDMGYDVLGRMISRTDSTGTTYFAWDGMDCIQELAPSGELTNYYMPEGVLLSFDRFRPEPRPVYGMGKYGTDLYWHRSVYNVMTDGLGSVRQVRDTNGVLVAQYDTDAWGNLLPSSFDSVPNGGCMYRYVGAAGVRWDSATGLYYMRQRWYDPTLQRFIGRDPLRNGNLYSYCRNNPATLVDPDGTVPRPYAIGPGPHDSPPVTANVLGGGVQPIGDPNTSGDNSNAFLKFLQGVRPCSISKLTIHGHGAKFSAGLDPSDANSPDRMIYFPPSGQRPAALGLTGPNIPDTDISSLLRRDMMPGGQILINDCHCGDETGAPGDVNFAKGLASQVPGVYVTGVQGDYYLRPDGMTTYAGGYHTYFYPGPPAPPSQP